jgi:hypothetical protein
MRLRCTDESLQPLCCLLHCIVTHAVVHTVIYTAAVEPQLCDSYK